MCSTSSRCRSTRIIGWSSLELCRFAAAICPNLCCSFQTMMRTVLFLNVRFRSIEKRECKTSLRCLVDSALGFATQPNPAVQLYLKLGSAQTHRRYKVNSLTWPFCPISHTCTLNSFFLFFFDLSCGEDIRWFAYLYSCSSFKSIVVLACGHVQGFERCATSIRRDHFGGRRISGSYSWWGVRCFSRKLSKDDGRYERMWVELELFSVCFPCVLAVASQITVSQCSNKKRYRFLILLFSLVWCNR